MKQGMPLRDPSTYRDKGFEIAPSKNAHDKANLTDIQPGDYPRHDTFRKYMEHMNDKIDY